MYADLILYSEPKRPLINPKYDLFAWLNMQSDSLASALPARVVDHVRLMLPENCRNADVFSNDTWDFIVWQVEEKGYAVVRTIDRNWLYWAVLANKYTLLNMVRILV